MKRLPLLLLIGCGSEPDLTPMYRPLTEARARPLTDRTFEATPERLARGEYLVEGALRWKTMAPSPNLFPNRTLAF